MGNHSVVHIQKYYVYTLCVTSKWCSPIELTAAAVWRNYQLFIEPLMKQGGGAGCDLFVSGGGAKNKATMR